MVTVSGASAHLVPTSKLVETATFAMADVELFEVFAEDADCGWPVLSMENVYGGGKILEALGIPVESNKCLVAPESFDFRKLVRILCSPCCFFLMNSETTAINHAT